MNHDHQRKRIKKILIQYRKLLSHKTGEKVVGILVINIVYYEYAFALNIYGCSCYESMFSTCNGWKLFCLWIRGGGGGAKHSGMCSMAFMFSLKIEIAMQCNYLTNQIGNFKRNDNFHPHGIPWSFYLTVTKIIVGTLIYYILIVQ